MNTRLILIEGIPGSRKSTVAGWAAEQLKESNLDVEFFFEGNLDHPADYEGVARVPGCKYASLVKEYPFIEEYTKKHKNYFLVSYRKLQGERADAFTDQLVNELRNDDIYELPLPLHMELITAKWRNFVRKAMTNHKIYVFDCCFIQNPVTMTFVKNNSLHEKIIEYSKTLDEIIAPLHPLLIYVKQDDIRLSFKKAVDRGNEII